MAKGILSAISCLTLLPALALSGAESKKLGSLCTMQDDAFASRFDWGALVLGLGLALFVLPLVATLLPSGWYTRIWSMTRFWWRYGMIGGLASVFVIFLFLGLPYLGILNSEWAVPALAAYYPLVQPDYLIECRDVAVTSPGILFGILGSDRIPVVSQPHILIVALTLGAGGWLVLFWIVTGLLRSRMGIASGR